MIIISYFIIRRFFYQKRKIKFIASIERISLCFIQPDLILPEVYIKFKYYYGGGVYFGDGYTLLCDMLDSYDYSINFNQYHLPTLFVNGKFFITEEHIEAYLLSKYNIVTIFIDPVEPYHSEIDELYNESMSVKL
ncbi:MAG: hypothetical protein H7A23_11860 [Leptospiraceae bacterium]|nr:hypothetical protein [Leptospiraceae bacterium]MCP5495242.1 hypothetical protein [Leptospiraceae bacterium]